MFSKKRTYTIRRVILYCNVWRMCSYLLWKTYTQILFCNYNLMNNILQISRGQCVWQIHVYLSGSLNHFTNDIKLPIKKMYFPSKCVVARQIRGCNMFVVNVLLSDKDIYFRRNSCSLSNLLHLVSKDLSPYQLWSGTTRVLNLTRALSLIYFT